MHLKRIKLAGFKSFVDPTSVPLPGRMVGIVGPNGCGKSNIIDAVRWVMGESSAKHLRGESMTDVIFSGSSERSPVGQASIELVFDNSDGAIGGQYAAFSELSVRRQVNRDAQSHYSLNGTRCRRRDITDVFLGTGLRPRGYTIIEQGMISRVIESRPEELRVYLEEAAGISVYKERRRETERRIRDTRDNLERLNDVRDELHRQLEKLRRQAEVAEQYRRCKAQERQLRAELALLRLRDFDEQLAVLATSLSERETQREAALASQRRAEREIESLREASQRCQERLRGVQGDYYAVGAELATLEERIHNARTQRRRREEEFEEACTLLAELEATLSADRKRRGELEERLEWLEPAFAAAEEDEAAAEAQQLDAREQLDAWRDRGDALRAELAQAQRGEAVEQTRCDAAARRCDELSERLAALVDERRALDLAELEEEIAVLAAEEEELAVALEALCHRRDAAAAAVDEALTARDQAAAEREAAQQPLTGAQARLTSLETLQEAALGRDGAERRQWLQARNWEAAPRLAERLAVDAGWERAVEVVLGEALQGLCLSTADAAHADGVPPGGGLLLVGEAAGAAPAGDALAGATPLAGRVRGSAAAGDLLSGVVCAADRAHAEQLRAQLPSGGSVITPDGLWMGADWVRLPGDAATEHGVLEREQEIEALHDAVATAQGRLEAAAEALETARAALTAAEQQRDALAAEVGPLDRRHADLQARLEHRRDGLERARQRRDALAVEHERLAEQQRAAHAEREAAEHAAQAAADAAAAAAERGVAVEAERRERQAQLTTAAEALRAARERRHDCSVEREAARTALASLREQLDRAEVQYQRNAERRTALEAALGGDDEPTDELVASRESLLARRSAAEEALAGVRGEIDTVEQQLREWEQQRHAAEQGLESVREGLESVRIELGTVRAHRDHEAAALAELDEEAAQLAERLPAQATIEQWERTLEQLVERLRRFGSVNLAAIEECSQLETRRDYLDAQNADLNEALETLEAAIRRIDRETRNRFRETFEQVNQGLGTFFPRLFGGGRAYLELTDDDPLSSGVAVLAQPPGKRVSSIHLLSGGEKALTAVALVFAIFQLNPAPFCLLDEVDAPLDEANVGRFCDLVEEMSARVQFVFITHNKTTMERASHLLGVTMNEPGVSRLVAVDVDAALDMAEAV